MEGSVSLISSEGDAYTVLLDVVCKFSVTLRDLISDNVDFSAGIPLPNISSKRLESIIRYCTEHMNDVPAPAPVAEAVPVDEYAYIEPVITEGDAAWCKSTFYGAAGKLDLDEAVALIEAASYLDITPLVELIAAEIQRYAIAAPSAEALYADFGVTDKALWYDEDANRAVCEQVWELAPKLKGP